MKRILEPELMDDTAQCEAYARADFHAPNTAYLTQLQDHLGEELRGPLVDLGCGPAEIPIRLCVKYPKLHVWAVDGAVEMLRLAGDAAQASGVGERVVCCEARVPLTSWRDLQAPAPFQTVLSNSLLHHLHTPSTLWDTVRALGAPGAWVFVSDLIRPSSTHEAQTLVDTYSPHEPDVLRRDFFNSLCAAFSLDEVRAQLAAAGLSSLSVAQTSDRHLSIFGQLPSTP